MVNDDILNIIACPTCKRDLILNKDVLLCKYCNKWYSITNDIPILLD